MHKFHLLLAFTAWIIVTPGFWSAPGSVLHAQTLQTPIKSLQQPKQPVTYSLSDDATTEGGLAAPVVAANARASSVASSVANSESSSEPAVELPAHEFPSGVSKAPGFPRKPLWERPGDFNGSQCMAPRYCQDENFRAGWPQDVRKRAICSLNDHYYAWYVGGGSGLPFLKNRSRTPEEGTWGLDYSLWKKPRTIWMKWTCGRYQGGEGAYGTDHESLFE